MNRTLFSRWYSLLFLLLLAVWPPDRLSADGRPAEPGAVAAIDVTGAMTVRDAGIAFRDVTEAYAATRRAAGRDEPAHYFFTAYGHSQTESGQRGILTSDGGGLAAGYYINAGAGTIQFLVVKLSNEGTVEWARIAGDGWELAYGVVETADGGFVLAGRTTSYGAGGSDICLIKFSSTGTPLWTRALGGAGDDGAAGICETASGDLVVAGYSDSFGGGDADALLAAVQADGTFLWAKLVAGPQADGLNSIRATADGGFVCAGSTSSFGAGYDDAWLVRFDGSGNLDWAQTLGGAFVDQGRDALEASSGELVLTGQTAEGSGASDLLFAIFDAAGSLLTASAVGGAPDGDLGSAVCELAEGGYAVAGTTWNFGFGGSDAFVVTFDEYGDYRWARVFGGPEAETANSITGLPGGGFFLLGETASFGQYIEEYGSMLVVAADENGLVPGCEYGAGCHPDVSSPAFSAAGSEPAVSSWILGTASPAAYWALIYWPNPTVCEYRPPEERYWLAASGEWSNDAGQAIGKTSDGGFLVAADAAGYAGDTQNDILLLKYDALGSLQWAGLAGGDDADVPRDLVVTDDDGCIVAGYTNSLGTGDSDALVMGFDAAGNLNWAKTVGGPGGDSARSVRPMPDGTYVIAGGTESVTIADFNALVFTVDAAGHVQWIRSVGGTDRQELAHCAIGTADGGVLIGGVHDTGTGGQYAQAIKLDASGSLVWQSNNSNSSLDTVNAILTMPDGNFVIGGITSGGDRADAYFIKIDQSTGGRLWARRSGSTDNEYFYDMHETSDGGIIAAGYALPPDLFDTSALLCKFDGEGHAVWAREVGGDGSSAFFGVVETAGGGFAAAGYTTAFGAGSNDVLVIHADRNGRVAGCPHVWEREYGNSDLYPAQFGYAMDSVVPTLSIYTQGPATMMPSVQHEEICGAVPTTSGSLSCTPAEGIAPFTANMQATLTNEYEGITRRVAGRIDVLTAAGGWFPNWRAGYTNIAPGESYVASWNQNIPALVSLHGDNHFILQSEDVTPAPYNQPPYPPAGDVDTSVFTLQVTVP